MNFVFKQLGKQIIHNRVFVSLLFILTLLTSLSFYFVIFSIDGNINKLNVLSRLTENQKLYKNALVSNTSLAYIFFISVALLTAFVFVMFFYRFFRANKKQIGCIKSLGFKDNDICRCFVLFVAVLSALGSCFGMVGGYFLSSILIRANEKTYSMSGLAKGVSFQNLVIGLITPTIIFSLTTMICYFFVKGKEPGILMAGNQNPSRHSNFLQIADKISRAVPTKSKLSMRIALRKPLAILLLFIAVMSFSVCLIIGQSLNISSQKVFESQTVGHNYEYDTRYSTIQTTQAPENVISYLDSDSKVILADREVEQKVIGLNHLNEIFQLKNINGKLLSLPDERTVYINPSLKEVYKINIGDTLTIKIGDKNHSFTVGDIAVNAKSASIYINANILSEILDVKDGAYNGILSNRKMPSGIFLSRDIRIENLNQNAVSNNISAVINQVTGGIIGAILIFLALYINFQDNTRDILILNVMGYSSKEIRNLLINIYRPIIWIAFIITLVPSVLLASSIQRSLSVSTNDYMPFGTNIFVVLIVFLILNFIYWMVQGIFKLGIKFTIKKEEIMDYVYIE